nr:hypothetical protein [Tanacetum cinerariifolium]
KPKASTRKKKGDSASFTTPPTPTPTTTVVAAPRLSAAAKGKQPARATTHTEPIDVERTEAEQLKIVLKRSRQETHISQQCGSDTDEGTDSHVTLTLVHPDGPQESSSVSSFVTSMLNPISDAGVESIFMTASSPIVSLQTPTPIMTPSTIATITTSRDELIHPTTILSIILENLLTFNLAFRFDERLRSLETTFSEYRQTNPFVNDVSAIPSIVHQYITQQMTEAVREAVQIQTDRFQDSLQRENDEFLRNIDENMKKIIKGHVKSQVKEQVLHRGSKRQREGGEHASASTPSETATESAGRSTTGSQSRQLSASESTFAEEPVQITCQMEEPSHPVFETDFSNFIMNHLNVDTLTPTLLAGPTYKLMRGSCTSLTELEYHFEEVYKATTDQLDWVNPEGQQYPHNLLQPLPLIPDNRGRRVIPFDHFINNDLEYLRGGASIRKYTTSVTKTKVADYGHIKWIKDLVPRAMWIQEPINYDRHFLWGVSHWGRKRQQFYGFAVNRESSLDVYSKRRIIAVTELKIVEWHNYKHLDWISVRRDDDKIYKFKEGDFKRLRLQDIEDMLLLLVQGKLSNLSVEERFAFNVSLRMFTMSIVIQRQMEDIQLGVESYQKRLNLTKPDTYRPDLKR